LIEIIKKFKQGRKTLTVLVDAFGRVNFGPFIYDRKGIIGDVKLVVRVYLYIILYYIILYYIILYLINISFNNIRAKHII
jgi:hypothetical protein